MKAEGGGEEAERGTRSVGSSFIVHPSTFVVCLALAGAIGAVSAPAWGQIVNDPTRPPGAYATGDPEAGEGGLVLQSVVISPTRTAAIINGEMVRLGEKYGDAVLIKVAENEVVLKSGDTTQVLKMYPGVEKREVAPAAPKAAPRDAKPKRGRAGPAATESPSSR